MIDGEYQVDYGLMTAQSVVPQFLPAGSAALLGFMSFRMLGRIAVLNNTSPLRKNETTFSLLTITTRHEEQSLAYGA